MRRASVLGVISWLVLAFPTLAWGQTDKRIVMLYDAFGPPSALKMDWGFAAFVEYGGRRILFDTGNNAKNFEHNVKELDVDLTRLDAVIISHRHGDHTSGLNYVLQVNPKVKIYAPVESAYFRNKTPLAFLKREPGLPRRASIRSSARGRSPV